MGGKIPRTVLGFIAAASALPSSAYGQADRPQTVVDLPAMSESSTAVSEQALTPMQMPAFGDTHPLSVAELRWCMSQEIGLEAIQPILGTHAAIDHQNELAEDFNRRCGARQYSRDVREEAARSVDEAREEIAAAAIEDIQRLNDRALTRRIQGMFELLGYELEVDGVYRTQTKEMIRAFQLKVGMPADGLVSERLLGYMQIEYMRHYRRQRARTSAQ